MKIPESISSNDSIIGLSTDLIFHKIVLYVDDVLLFIPKPEKSLLALMSIFKDFGSLQATNLTWINHEEFQLVLMMKSLIHLPPHFLGLIQHLNIWD